MSLSRPDRAAPGAGEAPPLFRSFWMGGFESACHVNRAGRRVDLVAETEHERACDEDYGLARSVGMRVVRDGVRWHVVERAGRYDFSSLTPMVAAAVRHRVQVVWNLMHYGWPDGLDPFGAAFVGRFARFAGAVARVLREQSDEVPFYVPVNEISFLAWAAGEVGDMAPRALRRGGELKRNLVRAALAAMDAVRDVDPRARFVHTDPVIAVLASSAHPELAAEAAAFTDSQFEAWDMLAGRRDPELGGSPDALDIVGANFYHGNLWELGGARPTWEERLGNERWPTPAALLRRVSERYERPLVLAETSHFGSGRAAWLTHMAEEVERAIRAGVSIEGICIYPLIDRPDWDDGARWHESGLWDLRRGEDGRLHRVPCETYLRALREAQRRLPIGASGSPRAHRDALPHDVA